MIDTTAIDAWLDAYKTAWRTDGVAQIGALFTLDARYYTAPYRQPYVGHSDIVKWWVGQENSKHAWSFEYEIVAREGDRYVVKGVTTYPEGVESPDPEVYDNIWLVTLTAEGTASEFIEYWMLRR